MNHDDNIDVGGLTDAQIEAISRGIMQRKSKSDPVSKLIANRAAKVGDLSSLTEDEISSAFNPEGELDEAQVRERMANYHALHNSKAPANRDITMRMGLDPSDGGMRAVSVNEYLDQSGIIRVRPERVDAFNEEARSVSPREVRQKERRRQAIEQVSVLLNNRTQAPVSPVVYVNFAESRAMIAEYDHFRAQGVPESNLDFLPLRAYVGKIENRRSVLANEVGVFQMGSNPSSKLRGKIVCLKDAELAPGVGATSYPGRQAAQPPPPMTPTPVVQETTAVPQFVEGSGPITLESLGVFVDIPPSPRRGG